MDRKINRVFCQRSNWGDFIEIHLGDVPVRGRISILSNLEFTEIEDGSLLTDTPLTLETSVAQKLMDELWNCGLRPSEGSGSAGALLATQNHLKDMQKMTDRLMNMVEKDE